MRTLPLLLILSALMLIAGVACTGRHGGNPPFGWSSAGARFDSLTNRMERYYIARGPQDSISRILARMQEMAADAKDGPIRQRAEYWTGRVRFSRGEYDEGYSQMEHALEMTDSTRYPHDARRIRWTLDMDYHAPTLERYLHLCDELDFFRNAGDMPVAAALAMELGMFLSDLGNPADGIPYLDMADSLFARAGFPEQVANNRINHANALRQQGDTVAAERIFRSMLADTVAPPSPYVRDIILGDLYALVDDTVALREAYRIVSVMPRMQEEKCLYENFICEEMIKSGELDSARYYHQLASENFPFVERPDVRLEYLRLHYDLFAREGRMDSAYHYLFKAAALSDSINRSDALVEISNANLMREITLRKLQADLDRRKESLARIAITFAIVLIAIAISAGMWRRLQRQKFERVRAMLNLERSNRRVMAMELVLKEKENLVAGMEAEMEDLCGRGEISRMAVARLTTAIKSHEGTRAERDNFIDTFGRVDPQFADRIRECYPKLTDADIRLAAFIALGLDSKHIARVMAIRPESVKQARWRLRSKLDLRSGESLEECVRRFMKSARS